MLLNYADSEEYVRLHLHTCGTRDAELRSQVLWLDLPLTSVAGEDGTLVGGSKSARGRGGDVEIEEAKARQSRESGSFTKIAKFLDRYSTARIIIVVDTHCLEENGAFVWKGTTPASYDACSMAQVRPIIWPKSDHHLTLIIDHPRLPTTSGPQVCIKRQHDPSARAQKHNPQPCLWGINPTPGATLQAV